MNSSVPKHIEQTIKDRVMQDLAPSQLMVHTKVGAATILGGLVSLTICGQFGIGLTEASRQLPHQIHAYMDPTLCSFVCGALYTLFPLAVLRFVLTSPLQFRSIVKRKRSVIVFWILGFGGTVYAIGQNGYDAVGLIYWGIAAIVTAHLWALIYGKLIPSWNPMKFFG